MLHVNYAYQLVQKSPTDLRLPSFGENSLRDIKEALVTLDLTLA